MAVITGGNIITGNQIEGSVRRPFAGTGAPVDGTTLAGTIAVGDFYQDAANGNLYEYTEPADTPTFDRIDTA
jgi:hypothetical protein